MSKKVSESNVGGAQRKTYVALVAAFVEVALREGEKSQYKYAKKKETSSMGTHDVGRAV